MHAVLSLIPPLMVFFMTFFIVAICVKLAAHLLRRTAVAWEHSLVFGVILASLTVAKYGSDSLLSNYLSPVLGLILAIVFALGIGAWFFRTRASNEKGGLLGWRGSLLFTGVALGLSMAFSFGLSQLIQTLLS